jgi:hypothetical protein
VVPRVLHALAAGLVDQQELKHDKPRLYEELLARGELEEHLAEPASPGFVRWAKIFGFTALAIGFTLVALIIYAMLFAYQ